MSKTFTELRLTPEQTKDFKDDILTKKHPLGSKVFEFTNDRYDHDLYQMLFNLHPKHLYEETGDRPSIILGRRGSGKSSYLNFLAHKDNVIPIPVKSWEIIDLVSGQIKSVLENQKNIDSEKVAEIWQLIFLVLATKKLREVLPEDFSNSKFLKELPIWDFLKGAGLNIISGVLNMLKNKYLEFSSQNFDLSVLCQAIGIGEKTLDEWETIIHKIAQKNDKKIIILIDNPEKLQNGNKNAIVAAYEDITNSKWAAYSGLLRILSNFNEGKSGIQARFCVPSEQFFFLQVRSDAILKDFSNIQILNWSSGDLLSMLAHRYMVFLQLHPEFRPKKRYELLLKEEIYDRKGALNFFKQLLVGKIKNDRGYVEEPIPYLLRHTQLLPRQLLFYFNKAISKSIKQGNKDLTILDASFLFKSIQDCESICASEIIHSYSAAYPEGLEMIDALDGFPLCSSLKNIRDGWSKFGAKKVLTNYTAFPGITVEADRFIRFLTETGVIGRVETQNRKDGNPGYINAEFEYTLPEKLSLNSSDVIAVHPIFISKLGNTNFKDLDPNMGVYPKGSDIDFEYDADFKERYIV